MYLSLLRLMILLKFSRFSLASAIIDDITSLRLAFWQPHVPQPQVRQPDVHLHLTLSYPLHLSIYPGTTLYTSKKSILPFESLFDKHQSIASLSIHCSNMLRFRNIVGVFKVILIAISALEEGEVDTTYMTKLAKLAT
ncbi:unnamed protein product [Lactuca saligna]|uniref:Uncharacterized protein n=1 Tax=Lactuca saligna TaxID=75948 RepID=A0AA35Y8P0_LACSI|nr:unnamed protein product [Lactuca saligna]